MERSPGINAVSLRNQKLFLTSHRLPDQAGPGHKRGGRGARCMTEAIAREVTRPPTRSLLGGRTSRHTKSGSCSEAFDFRHDCDNCRRCVVKPSPLGGPASQRWSMKLEVVVAVGQVLLGAVLLVAEQEVAASAALTMGLWMLGRTLSK